MRISLLLTTLCTTTLAVPAADIPERAELLKKAAAVRPAAADFVWQQIPWHTEPVAALKDARTEKRPLFVWLAGGRDRDGSPLERC